MGQHFALSAQLWVSWAKGQIQGDYNLGIIFGNNVRFAANLWWRSA